jgi:hypothetical protein
MRPSLSVSLLAVFAAISISACSKSSTSSNNSADQAAAASASSADNISSPAPAAPATAGAAPPVYPGAAQSAKPKGVADGAPPEAKAYSTTDDLAKVRAWYKVALRGAPELGAPDNDKTTDAFIVGRGKAGMVVILQSAGGKTWIIIGPVRLEHS